LALFDLAMPRAIASRVGQRRYLSPDRSDFSLRDPFPDPHNIPIPLAYRCDLPEKRATSRGHFATDSVFAHEEPMPEAHDWSWERYRQLQLDPRIKANLEASDLIQDTFLKAVEKIDQFRGQSEGERFKSLMRIFRTQGIDRIREETAKLGESSARWDKVLGTDVGRPDHEAERRKFIIRFAAAMEQLPDDQRDAVLLLHLMGAKLGRSCSAAVPLRESRVPSPAPWARTAQRPFA
jgi:RNA polymerase sigma-70 factor, ECF subfamily